MPNSRQYAERDKAFEAFIKRNPYPTFRECFNDGWHARKVAEYKTIIKKVHGGDLISGDTHVAQK